MTIFDFYSHYFYALGGAARELTNQWNDDDRIRINRQLLAKATQTDAGHWRIRIRCGSKYWHRIAKQMLRELAAREQIEWLDLSATVKLPEQGRSFSKTRGERAVFAHG